MAVRAYPDPIPEAYPNGANQAAIDAVDARNAQALLFAQHERESTRLNGSLKNACLAG